MSETAINSGLENLGLTETTIPIQYEGGISTDMDKHASVPEFINKEGKWFNNITGRIMDSSSLNLVDPSSFTIQGLGVALTALDASNIEDGIIDGGIEVEVNDIDNDGWLDGGQTTVVEVEEDDTSEPTLDYDFVGPWAEFEYMSSNQNNSGVKLKNIFEDAFIKESGDTIIVEYNITLVDSFPNQTVFFSDDGSGISSDTVVLIPIHTEIGGIVQPVNQGVNVYIDGDGQLINTSGILNAEVNRLSLIHI